MIKINGKEFRTAIVHDWFCNMGGGDKVAESFLDILPESPIYTSCYLDKSLTPRLKKANIITSYLQKKLNQNKDNHQIFLPLMPSAFESFDLSEYDIVLSSSSCCAKGVITGPSTVHFCYCHTPMRYAWEFFGEYTENMSPFKKKVVNYIMNYIRVWDVISSNRVDFFIANSENVAKRIWKHYKRESVVIHPPIDTEYFTPGNEEEDFYLCVSRLVKYKRIDLAIKACNELKLPLVVIGQGSEYENLRKIAGPTVRILGRQSDEIIREYYRKSKAFIFPGEEDFGMTPLESQACGRPVIAYGRGGALETVVDGKTGVFFYEQNVSALKEVLIKFEKMKFYKDVCRKNAEKFSKGKFIHDIELYITTQIEKRDSIEVKNTNLGF